MIIIGIAIIVIAVILFVLWRASAREIRNNIPTPEKPDVPKEDGRVVVEEPEQASISDKVASPSVAKTKKARRAPKSAKD